MAEIFHHNHPFTLESGVTIRGYHLAYTTLGTLNHKKDNAVWIFHALTANSDASEWWPGLVGEGKLFDPSLYFIVCVNMPGSCYGSSGPLEIDPGTNQPYYHTFPLFTTRDMVRSYMPLKNFLGIERIQIGIGGSMGGQQLLEWAIEEPDLFRYIFPIATNAQHSPWAIAFNASQRFCIETDPTWKTNEPDAGLEGMKAARSVALLSYRSYDTYKLGQAEVTNEKISHFNSESYQRYQGEKLAKRFNAFSYYWLSKSMDSHNVGRGRGSVIEALHMIKAKTLSIGIRSDLLFPVEEQEYLAAHIEGARFRLIDSYYGHDGFLLEFEQIQQHITEFIKKDLLTPQKLETTS
jgi:homoserine O-acetyltransferase/O-succinyltransferase